MNFLDIIEKYMAGTVVRVRRSFSKIFALAMFAGIFIGFGAAGSSLAVHNITEVGSSRLIAGMVFPVGLMMVLLTGAELFTGDCLFVMAAWEKRITKWEFLRALLIVYLGNLVGGVLLAAMIDVSGQWNYSGGALGAYVINIAVGKVSLNFGTALVSGILCNILVAGAVFMSIGATDIIGKLFCALFPIMLFVVCGFEHCVANMYYIPAGIFAAKNETYVQLAMERYGLSLEQIQTLNWQNFFLGNQLPVTVGNIIGGMLIIGIPILLIFKESNEG